MKVTLFFIAFLLFSGCENSKGKKDISEEKEEKKENTDRVEPVKEPDFYIAFKEDKGKTVYLTDSDEDVDRLIVDLRPLGVEVALLERPYWREDRCRKMSARKCVQGDCVVGNCALTEVGGWNVCRCQ
ncbi:MAG: hypothetical protein ABIT06_06040 [Saprospiraceae bacterium]